MSLKHPEIKRPEFVSYGDFEQLQEEVNFLKNKLLTSDDSFRLNMAVKDALKSLKHIPEIEELQKISENKSLTLLVITNKVTASFLNEIVNVEIRLAKKYPDLRINIQPSLKEDGKSCETKNEPSSAAKSKT